MSTFLRAKAGRIPAGVLLIAGFVLGMVPPAAAQTEGAKKKSSKDAAPFQWVNPLPADRVGPLKHGSFMSRTNGVEVGYFIYLPPGYDTPSARTKRYPVVYYLHGGRPGGESKSVSMIKHIAPAMEAGRVPPMIYVFVNGGEMSHYDFPAKKSYGETAFVNELIPHIDGAYRTVARREGRGIEGFSQGGRGTGRIMFKHPHLFVSCTPMGGGQQHEKHAAENEGRETGGTQFEPGNNTYDLARVYTASGRSRWPLRILVAVGSKDFNYEGNLDWSAHLKALGIPHELKIAGDAPHSASACYENLGDAVMLFHADTFRRAGVRW